MALGTPKFSGNTIITKRWFSYIVGTVAKKLQVPAPKVKGSKHKPVTWSEFKRAMCCMVNPKLLSFPFKGNQLITFGQAEEVLCCIYDSKKETTDPKPNDPDPTVITGDCLITVDNVVLNKSVVKIGEGPCSTTTIIVDSFSIGVAIANYYACLGTFDCGVSVQDNNDGSYTVKINNGPTCTGPIVFTVNDIVYQINLEDC